MAAVAKPREDGDVQLPPGPPEVALTAVPSVEGPLANVTFKTVMIAIEWLLEAVQAFSTNSSEVSLHITSHSKRLAALETLQTSQRATIRRIVERLDALEQLPMDGLLARMAVVEQGLGETTSRLDRLHLEVERQIDGIDRIKRELDEGLEQLKDGSTTLEGSVKDVTTRVGVAETRIDELEAREPVIITAGDGPPPVRAYDPFILRRPLGVSREFLDLKNQRGIQNLGQEHADLKLGMEDFQDAVKEEVVNLGSQITAVTADLQNTLDKHAQSWESKLGEVKEKIDANRVAQDEQSQASFEEVKNELSTVRTSLDTFALQVQEQQRVMERRQGMEVARTVTSAEDVAPRGADGHRGMSLATLGQVDVLDEVRRLRAVVESVQSVLPVDLQQRVEFFKNRGLEIDRSPKKVRSPSPPSDNDWNAILGAAADHHKGERAEILVQEQHRSTSTILRKYERDMSRLDAKVEDLWQRLPKVVELVQPVQDRLFKSELESSSDSSKSGTMRGQVPVLVSMAQEAWNMSFQSFKVDFQVELGKLRSDMEKALSSKAATGDVTALSTRLDTVAAQQPPAAPPGWVRREPRNGLGHGPGPGGGGGAPVASGSEKKSTLCSGCASCRASGQDRQR